MGAVRREVIIDRLATGGQEDGFLVGTNKTGVIDHCVSSEYIPELLANGLRKDLEPINVLQPDGPSFNLRMRAWSKGRVAVPSLASTIGKEPQYMVCTTTEEAFFTDKV
ncbi:hypothetical protein BP5796_03326 [Coleophoma crateriformis]|uniref:Uncharacterized protein n=1 Tax=Coleophoma crateriformis TaxID=565419 RepID=A0A3D8SMX0_9HELO|nr:hypothetical protein BP5796_03326 [Coleophoma crateriformis]